MKILNSKDFVEFVTETMQSVREGEVSPAAGNAVANLSGKILQMITIEMKAIEFPKLADRKIIKISASNSK